MTTATLTEDAKTAEQYPELTAVDRCDAPAVVLDDRGNVGRGACGAQAFVRVTLPGAAKEQTGGQLLFCGHHFHDHEAALIGKSEHIQDERGKINAKPSMSANAL